MSFRPRDDLEDTKSNLIYLDLSEVLLFTKDELDKTLSRIPDLRLKPDPLEEALNEKSNRQSFGSSVLSTHKQTARLSVANTCLPKPNALTPISSSSSITNSKLLYSNPVPQSMSHLNLSDFCGTEIDWKMLTLSRPPTQLEEEYFSKLVELYQLRHKTRIEDGYGFRKAVFRLSRHPRVMQYKPVSLAFDSFGLENKQNSESIHIKEDISYEAYARVHVYTTPNQYDHEALAAAAQLLSSGNSLDLNLFSD